MADFKWHWARPRDDGEFEPAYVDYRDEAPHEVWFAGNETSVAASDCEIGPEVAPMKEVV